MIPDGKNAYRHAANKKRESEIDIPDKFKVMKIILHNFGIHTITDEIIIIPEGGYADHRKPDLFCRQLHMTFELDGSVWHGNGDEISKPEKDKRKDADYKLANVENHRINSAVTKGYQEDLVVEELLKQGLKLNPNH